VATQIQFDREDKVEVSEDLEDVEDAIKMAASSGVSLVGLTKLDGSRVLINAQAIRVISFPGK
jgi:hypothetical protein